MNYDLTLPEKRICAVAYIKLHEMLIREEQLGNLDSCGPSWVEHHLGCKSEKAALYFLRRFYLLSLDNQLGAVYRSFARIQLLMSTMEVEERIQLWQRYTSVHDIKIGHKGVPMKHVCPAM